MEEDRSEQWEEKIVDVVMRVMAWEGAQTPHIGVAWHLSLPTAASYMQSSLLRRTHDSLGV